MATNISSILINSPLEKVWNVLTQPALVKKWQYGSDLITDWKAGSDIKFRTEWEGKWFEQWGKVLEILPHHLIRYSLFAPGPGLEDKPENYFVMIYRLIKKDGHTMLEIIQENNRPGAKQEAPQGEENPILSALKTLSESL
ncbi:MAG TPA: SRPBCC family protein [Puia sp.]|nr:SRPBCC family protein [Puia sp.]